VLRAADERDRRLLRCVLRADHLHGDHGGTPAASNQAAQAMKPLRMTTGDRVELA